MSVRVAPLTVVAVLALACGGAGSNHGVESDDGPEPVVPAASDAVADEPSEVIGSWENGSCGDREYNRRINFLGSGKFTAIDAVAPCPPDAQCVWSGIIRWSGRYEVDGDLIRLEIKPAEGEKMPDTMPTEFVVLGRDPLSIGERAGELVCPYRRVD